MNLEDSGSTKESPLGPDNELWQPESNGVWTSTRNFPTERELAAAGRARERARVLRDPRIRPRRFLLPSLGKPGHPTTGASPLPRGLDLLDQPKPRRDGDAVDSRRA